MQAAVQARRHPAFFCFVILFALAGVFAFASGPAASLSQPRPAARGPRGADAPSKLALANYGKLPLAFEMNEGQTDARVKFLSRGAGYTLFLAGDEAVLALRGSRATGQGPGKTELRKPNLTGHEPPTTNSILRMQLEGANLKAPVSGADELPGKTNYFIGNDPTKWRTNVPTYAKVKYEGVYPGVDLVYYGNQGQLEYDFVVAPGANPSAIRLAVAAVSDRRTAMRTSPLRIAPNGDLVVKISGGEVRFRKPVIYQPATGNQQPRTAVDGRYRLAHRQVTFEVGSYDKTRPLVVDPALAYSTYLGGSGGSYGDITLGDYAAGIAVDASGDAYVTGVAYSANFPVTPGAFQTMCGGNCMSGGYAASDAFVTKFNASGSALIYSTYLGGSYDDGGASIAIDISGNAYVVGATGSTDFPTTAGAFQTTCSGGSNCADAFVTKLNSSGSALVYSTYLGGTSGDAAAGVALDKSGDAYLTGNTYSTDFPTTPGAFDTTCNACKNVAGDAFVTEMNSTGSGLVYSTYLGGSGSSGGTIGDSGTAISLDTSDEAYVTGLTYSTDFPVTPGAFQTTCGGGCMSGGSPASDAFVTKFNATGSALVYSTYLGGSNYDWAFSIALDATGAYVAGSTCSSDFPTTPSAFQTAYNGSVCPFYGDGFITKLNPSGSGLTYSTYLGGTDNGYYYLVNIAIGIALDSAGDAYVTGYTSATNFPITSEAFQSRFEGEYDAFVTTLNPSGSALLYSTYLGGYATDSGVGITTNPSGTYVAGYTFSTNFPITAGAFQTQCGNGCANGNYNAFVTEFGTSLSLSPSSLKFGDENVGTSSSPQTITLSEDGVGSVNIRSIVITGTNSGDFAETSTCGSSLPPGASCSIAVTFTPTATGPRVATVTIEDSTSNSPQTVPLSGTGAEPAVMFSPSNLTFPLQLVYTPSQPQTVTLTNTGLGILTPISIAASSQFTEINTCSATLNPGASCTITVKFFPVSKGTLTGAVTVTDNAPGSPQTVSLTGTGTYVQLHPKSVSFGIQPVGTTSLPRTVSLTNQGRGTISIGQIAVTGTDAADFSETNTCGATLVSGASCSISVTFTPSAKGKRTAGVSIIDNGGGSPQIVSLTGTGT